MSDSIVDRKFNPEYIKYLLERTKSDDVVINAMLLDELKGMSLEKLKQGLSFVVYHNGIEYRQIRIKNKNEGDLVWSQHLENVKVAIAKIKGNVIRVDTFIEILNEPLGLYKHDIIALVTDRAFRLDFGIYVREKGISDNIFQFDPELSHFIEPNLRNFILDMTMLYKHPHSN